ncbi:cell division protein FtsQ/DivIB [Actinomadura macrotermitis]|uniref:cell division protein FtsQ/DivIB n=1 Tax=Actinomadura macrotermitis TaxID=2585200 RepID=UPI001295E44C|nr:FtsQ-type POTRA domain-containing protein [Actinomadura macrotermitis]
MTEAGTGRRTSTPGESAPAARGRAARGARADPGRPRRPRRWKAVFVTVLVVAVLGAAGWVLLGSRLLVVRHVEVSGARIAPKDRIVAAAGVRLGLPMVRLRTGDVRARVARLREVESAEVERRWPGTVRIVVRERVPVAAAQYGGRYLLLDRGGNVAADAAAAPADLPLLTAMPSVPPDPATLAALRVVGELPDGLRRRLAGVSAPSPESVTLRLRTGLTVVWGAAERTGDKVRLVEAMQRTSAGRGARTIDVSSPDVVTTR